MNDTAVKAVIGDVFDVQVKDIFGWLDNKTKATEIIDEVFGERAVIDFVALAGDVSKQTKSNGVTVWALGKTQFPLIVSEVF